jgi:hypothetical protein
VTELSLPLVGPLAWIDVVVLIWVVLTLASTAYVAWDAFANNPELTVMKWGWVLVTLYTGLLGAVLYVMSCKEPRPGTHERFISPLWKQGVGSTIHCVAGDATGIVFAATITALIGFPMWIDLIVEYAFGFAGSTTYASTRSSRFAVRGGRSPRSWRHSSRSCCSVSSVYASRPNSPPVVLSAVKYDDRRRRYVLGSAIR